MQQDDTRKDAYLELIDWSRRTREDFFQFGIEATVWPDNKLVREEWEALRTRILEGGDGDVYVRGTGRGSGTEWLLEMYKTILPNAMPKIDTSNNTHPTKTLVRVTGKRKADLVNYQVSHIIQNARNPFLFCCPWNVVWMPKYFDPLSGHETKGDLPAAFTRILKNEQAKIYADYISDYNALIAQHDLHSKTVAYLRDWQPRATEDRNSRTESSFRQTALDLFKPIDLL